MDNRGSTLMSQDFTATWLKSKKPYSSLYTSDFDQKYPNPNNSSTYLPSGLQSQNDIWENKNYYYASTYRQFLINTDL